MGGDATPTRTTAAAAAGTGRNEGLRLVWRRRYPVLGVAVASAVLALAASLLLTPRYTATVSILPDTDGPDLGVFEQIGILSEVGVPAETNIEVLYGRILLSDEILDGIVARTWRGRDEDEKTLYEVYGLEPSGAAPTPRDRHRLKRVLRGGAIAFSRDQKTGFMLLDVTVPRDPVLAAELANALTRRLAEFNRRTKRNRAAENRRFVGERLAQADSMLHAAEEELTTFVSNNRSYRASPELMQRYRELARVVEAETAVWSELKRQYEIARIEENRGLVRIDVLDAATPPLEASSPRRGLIVVAAFFAGAAFAVLAVLVAAARGAGAPAGPGTDVT